MILSDLLKALRSGRRGASCLIVLVALFPLTQVSFQDPFLNEGQKRLTSNLKLADLVLVGTVVHLGPPPKFKSGGFMALQEVRYKVDEVLNGVLPAKTSELDVQHVVVGGSRTADPSPEANRLSPSLFAVGSRLLVIAKRESSMWLGSDEDYGVIAPTDSNLRVIKQFLSQVSKVSRELPSIEGRRSQERLAACSVRFRES